MLHSSISCRLKSGPPQTWDSLVGIRHFTNYFYLPFAWRLPWLRTKSLYHLVRTLLVVPLLKRYTDTPDSAPSQQLGQQTGRRALVTTNWGTTTGRYLQPYCASVAMSSSLVLAKLGLLQAPSPTPGQRRANIAWGHLWVMCSFVSLYVYRQIYFSICKCGCVHESFWNCIGRCVCLRRIYLQRFVAALFARIDFLQYQTSAFVDSTIGPLCSKWLRYFQKVHYHVLPALCSSGNSLNTACSASINQTHSWNTLALLSSRARIDATNLAVNHPWNDQLWRAI